MPITARLSKAFYEKLGEQVTNELVAWFNDVDATYRTDLREINELNFARFDAKLEQRFAQQDAKWERRFAELRVDLAGSESRLLRWMFAFWTGNLVATAGLVFAVMRLGR